MKIAIETAKTSESKLKGWNVHQKSTFNFVVTFPSFRHGKHWKEQSTRGNWL